MREKDEDLNVEEAKKLNEATRKPLQKRGNKKMRKLRNLL